MWSNTPYIDIQQLYMCDTKHFMIHQNVRSQVSEAIYESAGGGLEAMFSLFLDVAEKQEKYY